MNYGHFVYWSFSLQDTLPTIWTFRLQGQANFDNSIMFTVSYKK